MFLTQLFNRGKIRPENRPASCTACDGPELARIREAFRACGVEFFELYGHGPPAEGRSFMWTDAHAAWQEHNPPPLETIGDQTVQQWRAAEKAVEKAAT